MLFHVLPSLAVVKLHPVIFAVLNVSGVFQRLSEQVSEVVIIWRVLEAKIADIAQIFVELFCDCIQH